MLWVAQDTGMLMSRQMAGRDMVGAAAARPATIGRTTAVDLIMCSDCCYAALVVYLRLGGFMRILRSKRSGRSGSCFDSLQTLP